MSLDDLKALLERATAGHPKCAWTGFRSGILCGPLWVVHNDPVAPGGATMTREVSELICALRNSAPALLLAVEALADVADVAGRQAEVMERGAGELRPGERLRAVERAARKALAALEER